MLRVSSFTLYKSSRRCTLGLSLGQGLWEAYFPLLRGMLVGSRSDASERERERERETERARDLHPPPAPKWCSSTARLFSIGSTHRASTRF